MHLTAWEDGKPIEDYDLEDPKDAEELALYLELICGGGALKSTKIAWEITESGEHISFGELPKPPDPRPYRHPPNPH